MERRRIWAHMFASDLPEDAPTSREEFIEEMMSANPAEPGFRLIIPKDAEKDVSQVHGYYKDLAMVVPLTDDADFRKSVALLAKYPYNKPNPLKTDLLMFERHLEAVCDSLISKKAASLRKPMLGWSYYMSEMARRSLVFMALQDAAAVDSRIKYTEEMVKTNYDGLLTQFESKFAPEHAQEYRIVVNLTRNGLLKPGDMPDNSKIEAMKHVEVIHSMWKQMGIPKDSDKICSCRTCNPCN
ncbi:hypothetical protein DFS34DRAFT_595404 [Phlyctochytrium arcticum]|nr:hypothetical protein DFS34DRAFT_595404 [Phlyctochytrium arcticum]